MAIVEIDHKRNLDKESPAAARAFLGTWLYELTQKHNALCAKLDADTGVAATDHVATLRVKFPEER